MTSPCTQELASCAGGVMDAAFACAVMRGCLHGLHALHAKRIVHRDVKLLNIVIQVRRLPLKSLAVLNQNVGASACCQLENDVL